MKKLALLGASGHGKVVADIAMSVGWQEIFFFDDAWPSLKINGAWSVIGNMDSLLEQLHEFDGVLVSIGNCVTRWEKHLQLRKAGASLVSLVHPTAYVSSMASLGIGSVVMPASVINVDAQLGEASIVNTGTTIDHDCILGDSVHISPGAHLSGNVTVGSCSWIGVGASVKQGIRIGKLAMVGAGAAVVNTVHDNQTVTGVPARDISLGRN